MRTRPIGFMDSGVGGLTVVKEVMRLLPNEAMVFLGDQARLPYGPRPPQEVRRFARQIAAFLQTKNIKLLVIACNTATAAALPAIRQELSIPVIGVIEPGSQAAVAASVTKQIGVIATRGTVDSQAYPSAIHQINAAEKVISLACPAFVTAVEANAYHLNETKDLVTRQLGYFKQHSVDTLIMGCTHFPLLAPFIQSAMGSQVTLIDAGAQTAQRVKDLLVENDLLNLSQTKGERVFYTTGAPEKFDVIARDWLGIADLRSQFVTVEKLASFA